MYPRLTINVQILQFREGLKEDGDDVFSLIVVHGHHLGREGDCDGTDPSGDVGIVNHSTGERGNTPQGQVDVVV